MSRRKKPFAFFLWHRRLGLLAFLLVMILSITGIMLNHTDALKLDKTLLESDLLLNWYDINPDGKPVNYTTGDIWISQWNQQLFFNGLSLEAQQENLRGFVQIDNIIALALENFVLLIDTSGEIIELMPTAIPFPLKKIGLAENKIALLDSQDNFYLSDTQLTAWHQHSPLTTQWSSKTKLTAEQKTQLKRSYRGQGLKLERVILDLHSGRLFNDRWGVYIMDASAVMMILLGLSGVWVWWSRRIKSRSKKHYQKHH